jgi:hypothetical protein
VRQAFQSLAVALALPVTLGLAPVAGAAAAPPGGHAAGVSGCSTFGPTWARAYNARAIVAGNPVRILAACCRPTSRAGVNHCFVTVTLAGTRDRGCESVDIGRNGLPAGPGRHRTCRNVA